jgi:DNA (cytosine-5)-methyltransferase 1
MITHYDLFAGIGGFSLALEEVFTDEPIRHIFCEWEQFPTAVLKQHWPDGEFYGDIADLVADTSRSGRQGQRDKTTRQHGLSDRPRSNQDQDWTIVTGGFPCQPFSHAGRRKGTADDRYQWPNMFEVIRNTKPDWVIAENVRGLVTWNEGMVLEQVCADLEAEGYEVQPFIIPAVAVNAPHRRDRVWIVAFNPKYARQHGAKDRQSDTERNDSDTPRQNQVKQSARPNIQGNNDADTGRKHGQARSGSILRPESKKPEQERREYPDWQRNWQEVAFATCDDSMDDGLPRDVGGLSYSSAKWRKEGLKAYGNAIVPQVAIEIMRAIATEVTDRIQELQASQPINEQEVKVM